MKKIFTAILAALMICLLTACGSSAEKNSHAPPKSPQTTVEQIKFYSNGQFKVGADISAGEYLAIGTGYVCVSTTPEANAAKGEILINDNIENARRYVTANDGEYIKLQGDIKLYAVSDAPAIDTSGKLSAGQYKVGRDIKSGEYKISLEPKGYFAVTNDDRKAIAHNQFTNEGGSFYATLSDGQYLQIKKGVGEFVNAVEVVQKPEPVQAPSTSPKVVNLGMTFEQFKAAYNSKIAEYAPETNWNVSASTLTIGNEQDVFIWQFTERVALMGMVEKSTNQLKKMVVMSLPNNQTDYYAAMLAYGLAIAILNPELNYGQRSELLGELHIFDTLYDTFTDLKQRNFEALRGNVKYQTGYMAEKGALHFWASAKDL